MRIGIDLDDTLCDTEERCAFYEEIYMKDKKISKETLWNDELYKLDFFKAYSKNAFKEANLKENAYHIIKHLRNMGHEIYIITARNNLYVSDGHKITEDYLKEKALEVDKIISDAGDKVNACIDNHIDLMIDNNKYNYDMLVANHINALLYDENENYPDENNRVSNWNEILQKVKKMKK